MGGELLGSESARRQDGRLPGFRRAGGGARTKVNTRRVDTTADYILACRLRHKQIAARETMALDGCVGSLRSSMQLLDSSINILEEATNDFPRLSKVLQTTRVGYNASVFSCFQADINLALRTYLRTRPPLRPICPPLRNTS
jgi:hypothetical protein